MPRNRQPRASGRSARKVTKTYESTTDNASDSDDSSNSDSYNGVNDISEDDGDEPDVERVEEEHLEAAGLDDETPRPSINDEGESWEGLSSGDELLLDPDEFFDEQMMRTNADDHDDADVQSTEHGHKTVRFSMLADLHSDSDSDGESVALFPDILEQESLHPDFRRHIEQDPSDDEGSDGSYWDHHGEEEDPAQALLVDEDEDNDEYDSDDSDNFSDFSDLSEGTIDDEDCPKGAPINQVQVQQNPTSSNVSSAEEEVVRRPRPPPKGRHLSRPVMGKWIHSLDKAFAVSAPDGITTVMFNHQVLKSAIPMAPVVPARSRSQSQISFAQDLASTMMSDSANIMMSAASSNPFGAAGLEAYYPWTSVTADGTILQDDTSSDQHDLDDLDDNGDLTEFFDFDAVSSDEKFTETEADVFTDATCDPQSTPARPNTADNKDQQFFQHLQHNGVGTFRRDQQQKMLLHNNVETKDSLAFGGPGSHLNGTLRGIKSGRLKEATTPITPVRKRKESKPIPYASSPGSPLHQTPTNRKRSFEGEEVRGHKRNRSVV